MAQPPAGQFRPMRYIATFLALVALLYALVFATGDHRAKPKLGIDLQGGTRVALTARSEKGTPDRDQLNQARQVIENRVNKIGVSGAEVILDGNQIIITVPGEGGDQAKSLGATGQMHFREVVQSAAAEQPPQTESPQTEPPQTPPSSGAPPPSTSPPSGASQPSSAPPQGRPAPALAGQPTTTPSQPAAEQPAQPDPTADCAKYLNDYKSFTEDTKAKKEPTVQVSALITEAKKCRQNEALAPSDDGTRQADPTLQQAALATLDCAPTAQDPLAGNDDPKLPLAACDQDGVAKYILSKSFLPGTDVTNASAQVDDQGVGYVVILDFNSTGGNIWADYTAKHVGKQAAFVLDTQVVSAPEIQEPIPGGRTRINGGQGGFKQSEARDLANVLKYGSLPLSFESSEAETVSATLGLASLEAGLIAGAIGLALVFVYCLFYYRLLGVLTILSLGLSGALVFSILVLLGRWIGFTLDLPGIAGFIVAIGITADSFVIFFERLKDEVREGRTFRSAVPRAWVRARRTVLSADAVVFLASAVLYILAVGQVRGFAFTLGMSTVLDLVVVFLVTHPLVALASTSKTLSHPKFSGLGAVQRMAARQRAAAKAAAGTAVKGA